jgi:hypothetical protein
MKKIIIIALSLLSLNALGADGSSGCGPGWYVFKKNSIVSSSLRATTNGILVVTVTLGMTMGTSNCSRHSLVQTEKESIKFATENYYEIAMDAAKGEGEFMTAFANTLGCKNNDLKLFKNEMRSNIEKIYNPNKADPVEMLKQTYILILNNKELLSSCSLS